MGTFNLLRNLTKGMDAIATKEIKFKQMQLICSNADAMGKEDFLLCKNGMCTYVTLQWIHDQLTGSKGFFVRRGGDAGAKAEHDKQARNTHELSLLALTSDWVAVRKNPDCGTAFAQQDSLAEKLGLKLGSVWPADAVNTKEDLTNRLTSESTTLKPKCAAITWFKVSDTKGHDVGLFKDAGSTIHFFDPNLGEYMINEKKNWWDFYEAYEEAIKKEPLLLTAEWAFSRSASLKS
jgi:hypothetical protein